MQLQDKLCEIYKILNEHFGELHWWPGETPFEVAVGAILTQNTSWKNVEIAIDKLKRADLLDPLRLYVAEDSVVAELIRSSGYYNIKTKRLKAFLRFLQEEYAGNMEEMFNEELWTLRGKLLGVNGIGEETADSILLYGGGKPVFVVDAYTRRILERHDIIPRDRNYKEIQALFMENLPQDALLYNQYHALLVNTGKHFCRKKAPTCRGCPLETGKLL
ncbi:MAG: endonuclease III domain-containing protein [Deltaproteobacteria bacterium]|nr:endonuclease III domain-containing protein [Deltaproteobacteria bacterium]MBW2594625.1 endonuclease III domain-containing protein [Deltaproteobacteria bacterium]MBW2650299.1 endonuclease III domain-containing protein [Deltaproteobacteria bacterium]